MFSYLRSNNRRSASPAASTPYSPPVRYVHSLQGSTENFVDHHSYRSTDQTRPSPISPDPPVLPPIPRVASHHDSPGKRNVEESVSNVDNVRFEIAFEEFRSLPTQDERVASSTKLDEHPAAMGPPPVPLQQKLQSPSRQLRPFSASSDSMRSHSEAFPTHAATKAQDQTKRGAKLGHAPAPSAMKISSALGASAAQGRQSKTKFNLLNPMSLLARRRSHQAVAEANSEKAQYKHAFPPVPGIPDDFDPRIRGNVVHDFSAPRPGSNTSSSRVRDSDRQREAILYHSRRPSPIPTTSSADDDSPSSGERDHTPQFKEHFDDDLHPLQDGPAKQGMSAFMYHVSLNQSQSEPHHSVLPPFARHLPSTITTAPSTLPISSPHPPRKSLEIVPETHVTDVISTDKSLPSTPPVSPPGKARSRASSNTDSPYQPSGLPKRIKSNASRFSFDMSGVGSATQEQLLEEKHRQNERKRANQRGNTQRSNSDMAREFDDEDNDEEDEEEYCDGYDDLGEADGIEERIPGINADEEEPTALIYQYHRQPTDLISPRESSFTSDPSLASTGITSPNTPRDDSSKGFGPFTLQAQPSLATNEVVHEKPHDLANTSEYQENHFDDAVHAHPPTNSIPNMDRPEPYLSQSYEDDMYFDDGMIDDLDEEDGHAFDESVFDDDSSRIYGLPLRDLKPLPDGTARAEQELIPKQATEPPADDPHHLGSAITNPNEESVHNARVSRMSFIPTSDMSGHAAYHDALVAGVNQAALNGKFSRSTSLGLEAGNSFGSNAGVILNAGPHFYAGRDTEGLRMDSNFEDADDFDLDDALEDDSIVAAANAEALENDDEGFYGQEFGFFARASSASEAEYANGGYFGSRGFEGLGRSHSGRNNDSSLTPITERSEWSNRNSAISLSLHGFPPYSAGPQPSPGLAQLVDMMQTVQEFHNPIPPPLRIPGV